MIDFFELLILFCCELVMLLIIMMLMISQTSIFFHCRNLKYCARFRKSPYDLSQWHSCSRTRSRVRQTYNFIIRQFNIVFYLMYLWRREMRSFKKRNDDTILLTLYSFLLKKKSILRCTLIIFVMYMYMILTHWFCCSWFPCEKLSRGYDPV